VTVGGVWWQAQNWAQGSLALFPVGVFGFREMKDIYVVGGQLRKTVFRRLEEWQSCKRGLVIQLNPETRKSHTCVEYVSPPEVCAKDLPAILFKSSTLKDQKLYACTSTEVLVYELPSFRLATYISLPCFNDLHHVYPSRDGTLLVAVTGLDMVVEVTTDGEIVREWDVLGEHLWVRFSREIDYRRVPTTKPHRSHPNHVFQLENEIWVTRLQQRDAVCLTRPGRRIDIAVQRPHDGYLFGDMIYFTTVDGHVVMANRSTLQVEKTIDLNELSASREILGWCRGVLPVNEHQIWVGFTRVRPTKFKENVSWIKQSNAQSRKRSHIALFDLQRRTCLDEIPLEPYGIGVVFSLFPAAAGEAVIGESASSLDCDETQESFHRF